MPSCPIYPAYIRQDATAKHRPAALIVINMHALGVTELHGVPIPQELTLPKCEPGDCFDIVLVKDHAELIPADDRVPALLQTFKLLICDSAGEGGQIAEAVIAN